jgi:hypothetical protein
MGYSVAALAAIFVAGLGACGDPGPTSFAGSSAGGGSGTGSGAAGQPMLVLVDTDGTLMEAGGQGVGVFVEYQAGGRWQVSWTCDTSVTNLPCAFQVGVSVTTGSITGTEGPSAAELSQTSAEEITVATTTTAGEDGVSFETTPGATITLNASMNGMENGSYLFFVQDNQVNGGYKGMLTDPLMLVPRSP